MCIYQHMYCYTSLPELSFAMQKLRVPEVVAIELCSFGFDDLPMSENETVLASVRMFTDCGFLEKFKIDQKVCKTLSSVFFITHAWLSIILCLHIFM